MVWYNYLETAMFTAGSQIAMMDKYAYQMSAPARAAGDDVLVPAFDLGRIYSPEMQTELTETGVSFTMNGKCIRLTAGSDKAVIGTTENRLRSSCEKIDGVIYVPAAEVMRAAFGKIVHSSNELAAVNCSAEERGADRYGAYPAKNVTVSVSDNPDFKLDAYALRLIEVINRGKRNGEQRKTFWHDGPEKVITYTMYVPTTYDPAVPTRLVVFLHGGTIYCGDKYAFEKGGTRLQKACQKYNYIAACANSVVLLSGFGGNFLVPGGKTEEGEAKVNRWADESLMKMIDIIKQDYNIDSDHMYLMGNSMGGGATFSVAQRHPGMFRAIAAGGAAPFVRPGQDLSAYKATPAILLSGTEDEFGFDRLDDAYHILKDSGMDIEQAVSAGGLHLSAWSELLDEAFDFYARH